MAFIDDFNGEASNVDLASHTPSGGTAWTLTGTSGAILCRTTGAARFILSTVGTYICDDQGSADHYSEAVRVGTSLATAGYLAVRVVDVDNLFGFRILGTGSTGARLSKVSSGTTTDIVSFQGTSGATYRVEADGNSIEIFEDGVSKGSTTDSDFNTETSQGLVNRGVGGSADVYDSFEAGSLGGGAFTLTADTGTFTLTGQAANLTAARKITADAATFSLTGQDANLVRGYAFPAEVGAFTFSGVAVNLLATRKITADSGTFALTGNDATLSKTTVGAFTLTADPGTFTYTGQAANLLATRRVTADVGTFTLTGNAATLTKSTAGAYTLTCDTASFAVTASAAGLIAARVMPAVTGSFALTGNAAAFVYGRAVVAEPGSFALTGNDATLTGPARIIAETGSFTFSGSDAALTWSGQTSALLGAARSAGRQIQTAGRTNIQTNRR